MKKTKLPKDILQELTRKRKENILLLSTWSDSDLNVLSKNYCDALETAFEENRFESYKILSEKLSQLSAAQVIKFSYSEEASDWIHW